MRQNSQFRRGAGCFNCSICGRQTRHTGVQAISSELCPQCSDIGSYQNCFFDGVGEESHVAESVRLAKEAIGRGGSAEKMIAAFGAIPGFEERIKA